MCRVILLKLAGSDFELSLWCVYCVCCVCCVCCVRCVLHGFSGLQLFFIFHLILLRFQQKLRGSEVCVKQNHFAKGSCSTPGSTIRGGRDHFTERKIDQIRGRLGKFGDLLTEIMRFQGF